MIFAWIGAAAVGLSLGILGSGGAILTIPILVYLVGHDEKSAVAESFAIVGAIAVAGVIRAAMQKRVDFRSAVLLAVPGILGTYAGADAASYIPGAVQLMLLAVLMVTAAVMMFRNGAAARNLAATAVAVCPGHTQREPSSVWVVGIQGVGLGFATGLVGVGGGFLIVPVLTILRGLPMPVAIGTSLAIIVVNSATGFLKYLFVLGEPVGLSGQTVQMDWHIIGVFSIIGIAGTLVGTAIASRINQAALKRIFAIFLIAMAAYILIRQAPRVMPSVFGSTTAVAPAAISHDEPHQKH